MKPIYPNPKEPWRVCEKQMSELDAHITTVYGKDPNFVKMDKGIRFERWAVFKGMIMPQPSMTVSDKFIPDHLFVGKICGVEQTILMWLPHFN
jgi:hypothetical protein